jgi:hypothetical protein
MHENIDILDSIASTQNYKKIELIGVRKEKLFRNLSAPDVCGKVDE